MSDTTKRDGGSGKSPTKFMERPDQRKRPEEDYSGTSSEDLGSLEDQELQDQGDAPTKEGWPKEPRKAKDPNPDPQKKDSRSGDTGDCAC